MRRLILTTILVLLSISTNAQIGRFSTVKLKSPTERTDFSNGYEWIPLMKKNGRINSFIHSDSLALKSDVNSFSLNLQQVTDVGNTTTGSVNANNLSASLGSIYQTFLNGANVSITDFSTSTVYGFNTTGLVASKATDILEINYPKNDIFDSGEGTKKLWFPYKNDTLAVLGDINPIGVQSVVAGANVTVDNTDPLNPIIDAIGFVDLTTTQTIGGSKTFSNKTTFNSGNIFIPSANFSQGIEFEPWSVSSVLDNNAGVYQNSNNRLQFYNGSNSAIHKNWEFDTSSSTVNLRTYVLQDKNGSLAHLDDIPTITAGTNVTIDNTDPLNPIINSTGGGGGSNTYSNGLTLTGSDVEIGGTIDKDTEINIIDDTSELNILAGSTLPSEVSIKRDSIKMVAKGGSFTGRIFMEANTIDAKGIFKPTRIDFSGGSTSTKISFEGGGLITSSTLEPVKIWGGSKDVQLTQATFNSAQSIINKNYFENNQNLGAFPTIDVFFTRWDTTQGNFIGSGDFSNIGNGALLFASYDSSSGNITARGDYSAVIGRGTRTQSKASVALGGYNVTVGSGGSTHVLSDPALVVGIGENNSTRKDGLVVRKDGVVLAPNLSTSQIDANILNTSLDKTLVHVEYLKERFGLTNPGFDPNVLNLNKQVWLDELRITQKGSVPATSTSAGLPGQIRYDDDHIYICTASNTWKRISVSTW